MPSGRVSVIIPNFNNGRGSSRDGRRDIFGELLRSLECTLAADRELLEILVADDGSTDDSLDTARAWAAKRWRGGEPFLRLIELPHSGVLSSVLNRLLDEARGDYIARLDGDLVLRTADWASILASIFDRDPAVGVVTGVQLLPDGSVHALGDDLWGPRGYRHIAQGARLEELGADREVDHAMGCFYATRKEVRSTAGPYDESVLRGQTEEYGVRVRLAGWKVIATPRIAFEHWHVDRAPRANRADHSDALESALDRFRAKWGFDRLAPDLAAVEARHAGTGLWWRDLRALGVPAAPDDWERLQRDAAFTARLSEEFDLVAAGLKAASGACAVTQIGSGCGCLGHAIARAGGAYEGFEERGPASEAAQRSAALPRQGPAPRFIEVDDLARLPVPDASRPLVATFGTVERYWNPVGLLNECRRVVAPGGVVLLRTKLRPGPVDDPRAPGHPFTADEFLTFLRHHGGLRPIGFDPRVTASGWLECCLTPTTRVVGRGYFAQEWKPLPSPPSSSEPAATAR